MNSLFLTDGYKLSHHNMYPEGTTLVFSNITARSDKYAPKQLQGKGVVIFGVQMALKMLHEHFNKNFFSKAKEEVIKEFKSTIDTYLNTDYDVLHFEKLHDLGYLPIEVRALEEGTICPIKVPFFTIHNTKPEFFWLTNYLETILSNLLWKPIASATIAKGYREILNKWAIKTTGSTNGVEFQGHDFSMRGLDSIDAAISSGLGHLTSFSGSDSLPALHGARKYYNAEGFIAGSVPATEHSVMCAGTKEGEFNTYNRLLDKYPKGFLSVVSDTWDLWNVVTEILPKLKDKILARDGRLIIRPDSGNPVDILCGTLYKYEDLTSSCYEDDELTEEIIDDSVSDDILDLVDSGNPGCDKYTFYYLYNKELYEVSVFADWGKIKGEYDDYWYLDKYSVKSIEEIPIRSEYRGLIELLWNIFGGTINEQGYKVLDPHIGAIYGDSITLDRAEEICKKLEAKGFASTNVVFGIGSYTYQYNTRDTFGMALKATYIETTINSNTTGHNIFKNPITDNGLKKSAKGLVRVIENENKELILQDSITWEEFNNSDNKLELVYKDGVFKKEVDFVTIKNKLDTF